MMRVLSQSGPAGLAGMPALAETRDARLLRPLLAVEPTTLRSFLRRQQVAWVEDPSNRDLTALAAAAAASAERFRHDKPDGSSADGGRRPEGCGRRHCRRVSRDRDDPARGVRCGSRFTGSARMRWPRWCRRSVVRSIRRTCSQMTDLAAAPRPATVAGVRIVAAGETLLLVREEAAMADPVAATEGVLWDGRMRFSGSAPHGAMAGALAQDAAVFRRRSSLPSVVMRTMPALRLGNVLLAVPHLGYVSDSRLAGLAFRFDPPRPCAGGLFHPI